MKIKILLVGKNSFIATSIYKILYNKSDITKLSFSSLKNKKKKYFIKFDFIINCSINQNYIKNKYKKNNDIDLYLANKIESSNCKYIFISTRKVYSPKYNIKETNKTKPIDQYGKNKLKTENNLYKILTDKLLVVRASNIIGLKMMNKRKAHTTFLDYFCKNIFQNKIIDHKNVYKDFLSINQFVKILFLLMKKNVSGVINVSLGKKVYLKDITKWLNYYNVKNYEYINNYKGMNFDSFTLNNSKLKKIIKNKILISDLKEHCLSISKKIFLKK